MNRICLIGALALICSATLGGVATPGEPGQVACGLNIVLNRKCAKRNSERLDSEMSIGVRIVDSLGQGTSTEQGHIVVMSDAKPGDACSDQSAEPYYDDTWEGYRGGWLMDCRTSPWTVVLTLASSVFATAAGYWLFGDEGGGA